MNRYPVWKYAIIVIALLVGAIYTLPNLFGEAPAVQISAGKATVRVDSTTQTRVEQALANVRAFEPVGLVSVEHPVALVHLREAVKTKCFQIISRTQDRVEEFLHLRAGQRGQRCADVRRRLIRGGHLAWRGRPHRVLRIPLAEGLGNCVLVLR